MKQQINLYKVEKQKFVLPFTFYYVIRGFGVFILMLGLTTSYDLIKHFITKKEFQKLGKEHAEKEVKLQVIAKQVPEERTRNEIVNDIQLLEAEKKEKIDTIALLMSESNRKVSGFSIYLDFLANHTVPGVWLTKFSFKDNGNNLVFKGKALKAENVTQLITSLSSGSVFSGKTFEMFKVEADPALAYVDFILQSKNSTEGVASGADSKL